MPDNQNHIRLSEFLGRVQQALKAALPDSCWVVAELTAIKHSPRGHVYLDILESESGREIAKARATMFANAANSVMAQWQQSTGGLPQPGMKLLMKVRAEFNVQYGFSLQVSAIDPAYTLGDMQLQLQQVIVGLQTKGWFDLQRALPSPAGYWRIGVIAPHQAAGLADFRRDADRLDEAGVCTFEYFSATFQGREASESIRTAMKAVHDRHQEAPFDVVCIIRGGGAKADLAWLNDGQLAAWACRFPIPLYTGIGHEIDECVLDMVAHRRFDTPSKVIGYFRSVFQREAAAIRFNIERISSGLLKIVAHQRHQLEQAVPRFAEKARLLVGQHERRILTVANGFAGGQTRLLNQHGNRLQQMSARFQQQLQRSCTQDRMKLQSMNARFASDSRAMLNKAKGELELTGKLFDKTNPLALLTRGFALARDGNGQIVTSAQAAHEAGRLNLTFGDGVVETEVFEPSQSLAG